MADYSIAVSNVPLAGTAVGNIDVFNNGTAFPVTSITATWRDNNNVILSTLTNTGSNVSGTDIYGNAVALNTSAGVGLFQARLVVDATHYSPSVSGLTWSLNVSVVVQGNTYVIPPFKFQIIPASVTVALDPAAISPAVMRQTGYFKDVTFTANSTNAIIPLMSGIVYAIQAAYKNGVAMVQGTDYSWATYRGSITLTVAPALTDDFLFTVQTKDTQSVTDVITRYTQEVLADLQAHFNTVALLQSPTVAEVIKNLCVAELKMEGTQGTALDSARFRSSQNLMVEARKQIIRIQRGEATCYDSAGNQIPRIKGAVVGAYHHPEGDFVNRLGLINRGEQFTGVYVAIAPSPAVLAERNPVSVTSAFSGAM